ncbi:MAG: Aminobutyraldehyde dehydrogenase, partial [uncultured Acetobacteraceae bacterium]
GRVRLRGGGGRRRRLGGRARPGARRTRGAGTGRGGGDRHRDLLAQFRGDPRRHLLPRREPDGARLRRRQAHALRVLPGSRCALRPLRQADRGHQRGRGGQARSHPRTRRRQWGAGLGVAAAGGGAGHGAGAVLHRGPPLAFHRHHRQPRLHAFPPGRRRERRRGLRLPQPGGIRAGQRRRHRDHGGRRRADRLALPHPGQLGRLACSPLGPRPPRYAGRRRAGRLVCQGQLLHPRGTQSFLSFNLPGACAGRPRDTLDHRPRRSGPVRAGRGMGGWHRLRRGPPARRRFLRGHSALLARPAGGLPRAGIFRDPSQDGPPRRAGPGLHRSRPGTAPRARTYQPFRDRVSWIDRIACIRRICARYSSRL